MFHTRSSSRDPDVSSASTDYAQHMHTQHQHMYTYSSEQCRHNSILASACACVLLRAAVCVCYPKSATLMSPSMELEVSRMFSGFRSASNTSTQHVNHWEAREPGTQQHVHARGDQVHDSTAGMSLSPLCVTPHLCIYCSARASCLQHRTACASVYLPCSTILENRSPPLHLHKPYQSHTTRSTKQKHRREQHTSGSQRARTEVCRCVVAFSLLLLTVP